MRIGVRRLESGDDPQNALPGALKGFAGHIRLLRISAMPFAARNFDIRARLRNLDSGSPWSFLGLRCQGRVCKPKASQTL
jgi:hypothetical protein